MKIRRILGILNPDGVRDYRIEEYEEAYKEAEKILRKHLIKKPIKKGDAPMFYCPECECLVGHGKTTKYNFCPECGKRIDWRQ